MVDLEAHCFPPATTLGAGGATWGRVSPFLVIPVPSLKCHCMGVDLSGLTFLWLLEVL